MQPELSIHIHEDDFGLRVIVPLAAMDDIERDFQNAKEHHRKHTDEHGYITQPYLTKRPSFDYSAVPLGLAEAASVLEKHFPRIRKFTQTASAGFEPGVVDSLGHYEIDAHCYGTGADCFIKLEHKDGVVHTIWFDCLTSERDKVARFRGALNAFNDLVPSVVADYWFKECGAIGDEEFMDWYCATLLKVAS